MTSGLDVLKTSDEDLLEDGVISDVDDEAALVAAMRSLVERSAITHLVVTRGAKPALALSAGRLASVHGPRLEVQDPRGGGDSVTAGLTAQLCRGVEFWDALRLGVAARSEVHTSELQSLMRISYAVF